MSPEQRGEFSPSGSPRTDGGRRRFNTKLNERVNPSRFVQAHAGRHEFGEPVPIPIRNVLGHRPTDPGLADGYGGVPLSIQVRKRSTSSAGQRPSQGMVPAASLS